ncbi:unknown [Clostridium sp. CAG:505]|nr:unknown [Clostridium sp. CAG:505]
MKNNMEYITKSITDIDIAVEQLDSRAEQLKDLAFTLWHSMQSTDFGSPVSPQHINTVFLLYSLLEEFSEAMFEPVTELNNLYTFLNAKQVGGEANV